MRITRLVRTREEEGADKYCSVREFNGKVTYAMGELGLWQHAPEGWSFDKLIEHFLENNFKRMKEIKTEVDWLNAIQDNFKEGV